MSEPTKPICERLLVGITGSLFAASLPQSIVALRYMRICEDIRAVVTWSGTKFVSDTALRKVTGHEVLTSLEDESDDFVVPHVELASWADLVVVMPATAHCLAELAGGFAGNLVTATVLGAMCPVVLVPGMDTAMWNNPIVQRNVETLRSVGHSVVPTAPGIDIRTLSLKDGGFASLPAVIDAMAIAVGSESRASDYLGPAARTLEES